MDVIDETILKMVIERASVHEMAEMTGRSNGGIKLRLEKLIENGYIKPPPKPGMARSYRITEQGMEYLQEHHYA